MIGLLIFAASALGALLVANLGLKAIRIRSLHHKRYAESARMFFRIADRILDDPNAPDDAVDLVETYARTIDKRSAPIALLQMLRQRKRTESPVSTIDPFDQDAYPMKLLAAMYWYNAITARAPIIAEQIRLSGSDADVQRSAVKLGHSEDSPSKMAAA